MKHNWQTNIDILKSKVKNKYRHRDRGNQRRMSWPHVY